VSEQENAADSILAYSRQFLSARKHGTALRLGEMEFVGAPDPVLAFVRADDSERVLCVFNMSRDEAAFRNGLVSGATATRWGCGEANATDGELTLAPLSAWFAYL
jgi:alpha-glucosidase